MLTQQLLESARRMGEGPLLLALGEHALSPAEITARIVIINLHGHLEKITQTPKYNPNNQIQLLIQAMSALTKDSPLLPTLFPTLCTLIDLSVERQFATVETYLEALQMLLKDLPPQSVEALILPENSVTVGKLIESRMLSITEHPLKSHDFDELELKFLDYLSNPKLRELRGWETYIFPIKSSFMESMAILKKPPLDLDHLKKALCNILKIYKDGYLEVRRPSIDPDDPRPLGDVEVFLGPHEGVYFDPQFLKDLIQLILNTGQTPEEKLNLAKTLFACYDTLFGIKRSDYPKREECYLFSVLSLAPILNKALRPGEFLQMLRQQNFSCCPSRSELDFYHAVRCIVEPTTPPQFDDKNYHRTCTDEDFEIGLLKIVYDPRILRAVLNIPAVGGQLNYFPGLLSILPLDFQEMLCQQPTLKESVELFIEHYNSVNSRAADHQKRDITLLLITYWYRVQQLIHMMGVDAINYMHKLVANTALPLERMLRTLPLLDERLATLLGSYVSQIGKLSFADCEVFIKCLNVIPLVQQVDKMQADTTHHHTADDETVRMIMELAKEKPPAEFLKAMLCYILRKIFGQDHFASEEQLLQPILDKLDPERCAQLLSASRNIPTDDGCRAIYLELLRCDSFGGDAHAFLYNREQPSEIGRSVAHHNYNIAEILRAHHVDPDLALQYKKKLNFVITPSKSDDSSKEDAYSTLFSYLIKLKESAENLSKNKKSNPENNNGFDLIIQHIERLKKIVEDGKPSHLKKPTSVGLLNKIEKECSAIIKRTEVGEINEFHEFADHVMQQRKTIKDEHRGAEPKNKNRLSAFSVKQWDKADGATFSLGNEVGCCLSSDSGQFLSMLCRRIDAGCPFFVAEGQGRIYALLWTYFALTQDGKLIIILNFPEVNAKYGSNKDERLALLYGLLSFMDQYLKDNPGIEGFYMNPLQYGWNMEDLDSYPKVTLRDFDKLGGPYIRCSTRQFDVRGDREQLRKYYFNSLSSRQLHQFSGDVLRQTKPVHVEELAQTQESRPQSPSVAAASLWANPPVGGADADVAAAVLDTSHPSSKG